MCLEEATFAVGQLYVSMVQFRVVLQLRICLTYYKVSGVPMTNTSHCRVTMYGLALDQDKYNHRKSYKYLIYVIVIYQSSREAFDWILC
jgi:hypothetical protein